MTEAICHFGKHKGKPLSEIPSGYLRWCVEKIDPKPSPKYRFEEDGVTPLTTAAIDAMEEKMRQFLSDADNELLNRDQT